MGRPASTIVFVVVLVILVIREGSRERRYAEGDRQQQ
jgi:hypothetical protein